MNIKHILVPVDFSDSGNAAVAYAISLAKEYEAEVHLVHVYEAAYASIDAGFTGHPIPTAVSTADLKKAEARLAAVVPAQQDKFRRICIVGDPSDELVNYAKDNEIDLIVMGTHGRTGITRLLMGSVAEATAIIARSVRNRVRNPAAA